MPQFFGHGRALRGLLRRWGIASFGGGGARFREISSWIQPGLTIDRDWQSDDRLIFGYTADAAAGVPIDLPAVAIFAGNLEVHLRKIDFLITGPAGGVPANIEANILTPDSSYNPVLLGPGEFFPFMQTSSTVGILSPLKIPQARVVGGRNASLYSVTIGGVPVFPAIGPRYRADFRVQQTFVHVPLTKTILDWDDPPIILPPFKLFAVQMVNPSISGDIIIVNLYFSERVAA